jgi:hypothetical protein
VNGQPGRIMQTPDGRRPDHRRGRRQIQTVRIIRNPEKLGHV